MAKIAELQQAFTEEAKEAAFDQVLDEPLTFTRQFDEGGGFALRIFEVPSPNAEEEFLAVSWCLYNLVGSEIASPGDGLSALHSQDEIRTWIESMSEVVIKHADGIDKFRLR